MKALNVAPGKGRTRDVLGIPFMRKASSSDTRGAYFATEVTLDGDGPPLHVHHNDDEAMYVLEGTMSLRVDADETTASKGSFHLVPRGVPHTIWNATDKPVRALLIFSPGETEQFVEEAHGVTDLEEIVAIATKNGMEILEV